MSRYWIPALRPNTSQKLTFSPLALWACLVLVLAACGEPEVSQSESVTPSSEPRLEALAEIQETRPGNIAVTPQGRVIITNQPLDSPRLRVVEVMADGSTEPFPNLDWADGPESGEVGIAATIGIASSTKGVVWILDMGGEGVSPRLLAWDSADDDSLLREIEIAPAAVTAVSFLQDFALDEKRQQIYIADMTFPPPGETPRPAFIVVDLESGESRRVLEGTEPLMPVPHDVVIRNPLASTGLMGTRLESGESAAWHLALNPIAIDPDFEWVYFGTVNGDEVFRIPAEGLANAALDEQELSAQIEVYGEKRPSDGIAVDGEGRVFISDIEASAIGVTTPQGYEVLVQDDRRLAWPDGFALAADGSLYVTQNQLFAHPALNEGVDETTKPFHILRLDLGELPAQR
ncbi:MAG: L-dopachrome tautomerase-related protein [Acidobacteriota bacterium]